MQHDALTSVRFSNNKAGVSKHGRHFTYRELKLPWDGDCTNVFVVIPAKNEILIGTELGNVLLFDLSRNKCRAMISADEQVSGVCYHNNIIWSVGRRRRIVCHGMQSGSILMAVQEPAEIQNYSDMGITFNTCFNKEYLIYNCGLLTFNIFHLKSRKLIKKVDVAHLLKDHPSFLTFTASEKVAWRYCVGKIEPKLFIILNRYHPHLIIFDYLKYKVEVFEGIFPRVDWQTGPVVPVISLSLMVSDNDDFIFFVNQTRDQYTRDLETYLRVITRSNKKVGTGYVIHPIRKFPSKRQFTS